MNKMVNGMLLGQVCRRSDCDDIFYYMGEYRLRNPVEGKTVQVFVKFNKKFQGFRSFDKLSEFDECMQSLNKVTTQHFLDELEMNALYHKVQ